MRAKLHRLWVLLVTMPWLLPGCVSQRYVTQTPRSSTEQLLLSRGIHGALDLLEWPDLTGRKVAVETTALLSTDAPYVQAAVEARARRLGAHVVPRENAQIVLAVLAGSIGTDSRSGSFGIPALPTPFGFATPQIDFVRSVKQHGYVSLALSAFDSEGGFAGEAEPVILRKVFETYSFLFLTFRRNDVYPGKRYSVGFD
jgi:hypothetical protein